MTEDVQNSESRRPAAAERPLYLVSSGAEEAHLDLLGLLESLGRGWRLLLGITVCAVLAAGLFVLRMPDRFESKAVISAGPAIEEPEELGVFRVRFGLPNDLERVARELNIRKGDGSPYSGAELSRKVRVKQEQEAMWFEVVVVHSDADMAKQIAEKILESGLNRCRDFARNKLELEAMDYRSRVQFGQKRVDELSRMIGLVAGGENRTRTMVRVPAVPDEKGKKPPPVEIRAENIPLGYESLVNAWADEKVRLGRASELLAYTEERIRLVEDQPPVTVVAPPAPGDPDYSRRILIFAGILVSALPLGCVIVLGRDAYRRRRSAV